MDHRVFRFATRGHCIKGKQCYLKQNMCLRSKQSSLFSFYALPSGGKSKDAVVHWLKMFKQSERTSINLSFTFVDRIGSM